MPALWRGGFVFAIIGRLRCFAEGQQDIGRLAFAADLQFQLVAVMHDFDNFFELFHRGQWGTAEFEHVIALSDPGFCGIAVSVDRRYINLIFTIGFQFQAKSNSRSATTLRSIRCARLSRLIQLFISGAGLGVVIGRFVKLVTQPSIRLSR